jgi:hypothetical protein
LIISDASRYEAAHELAKTQRAPLRSHADSQLMLPADGHGEPAARRSPANGDVLADGLPTSSTEQRGEILAVGGMPQGGRPDGDEEDEGRELVGISGSSTSTTTGTIGGEYRGDTFQAVRRPSTNWQPRSHVINKLNGSRHRRRTGFLSPSRPRRAGRASSTRSRGDGAGQEAPPDWVHLPDHEAVWHGRPR